MKTGRKRVYRFKKGRASNRVKITFLFLVTLSLTSCFSRMGDIYKYKKSLKKGKCEEAYHHLSRIQKKLSSSDRVFLKKHISKCQKSLPQTRALFYERLFLDLDETSLEKTQTLEILARLYFYEIRDYQRAITYYRDLLNRNPEREKKLHYMFQLSRAFFNIGNYTQALLEIEEAINTKPKRELLRSLFIFKGVVLKMKGDLKLAEKLFRTGLLKFPEYKNGFHRQLALVYEEKREFKKAIRELEKVKPKNLYIKDKLKMYYQRLESQPWGLF